MEPNKGYIAVQVASPSPYLGKGGNRGSDDSRKMFIGGLSFNSTDDSLKAFYSQFGEVVDCIVMRDGEGRSRCFGFVTYSLEDQVDAAMKSRPHEIDGKVVDPKRAISREKSMTSPAANISSDSLYVANIRPEHTEEDLMNYFKGFGNVIKVNIVLDQATKLPRGFAFINFDDHDAVDKCVLKGSHYIKDIRCDVKKSIKKEDMAKAHQLNSAGPKTRGMHRSSPYNMARPGGRQNTWNGQTQASPNSWQQMGYPGGNWPLPTNAPTAQWGTAGYNSYGGTQPVGGYNAAQMWPQGGQAYSNTPWNSATPPTNANSYSLPKTQWNAAGGAGQMPTMPTSYPPQPQMNAGANQGSVYGTNQYPK